MRRAAAEDPSTPGRVEASVLHTRMWGGAASIAGRLISSTDANSQRRNGHNTPPEWLARIMKNITAVICCLCLHGSWIVAAEQVPVAEVVAILEGVEQANQGRYRSGELEFTLRRKIVTERETRAASQELIDGKVKWRGDKVRTDLRRLGPASGTDDLGRFAALAESSISDGASIIHLADNSTVSVTSLANKIMNLEYCVVPDKYWYPIPLGEGKTATELLNIVQTNRNLRDVRLALAPNDINGILLICKDADGKFEMKIRLSYQYDHNIELFEYHQFEPRRSLIIKNEWSRDGSGRVYLGRSQREDVRTSSASKVTTQEEYETTKFLADARVDPRVFSLESLNLKSGTVIRDSMRGKTYKVGDHPTPRISQSLPELIRVMQARGFASRKRTR